MSTSSSDLVTRFLNDRLEGVTAEILAIENASEKYLIINDKKSVSRNGNIQC